MSGPRGSLAAAVAGHRAALELYAVRAREIPPSEWDQPATPGKWSPGEITEHLRLALETLEGELRGEGAMRCLLPWWKRFLLRQTILPRILSTGRFPRGVRAPREIRPASTDATPAAALSRLSATAERFAAACVAQRTLARRLTHPYFGGLPLSRFHRLLAAHTLHHREQLPRGPWEERARLELSRMP
jgi:DinB superfamily